MLIFLIIIAGIAIYLVTAYNGLVRLKNEIANAWRQIDVQLKRRHDLIPNLVEAVKGYMEFERDTLTQVVEARNRAVAAPNQAAQVAAENQLAFARQAYNDVVLNYNTRIQSFPTNMIANNFGFTPAEYFKIDEPDRAVPKVDLSLGMPHS
jgi:LemA protein